MCFPLSWEQVALKRNKCAKRITIIKDNPDLIRQGWWYVSLGQPEELNVYYESSISPPHFFLNMCMLLPFLSLPHAHTLKSYAMPVLTRQLKDSAKSPGGQSDDIRQQLKWCWSLCFPSWFHTAVCMLFVYDMTLWSSFSPGLSCCVARRAWPSNAAIVILSSQYHSCHLLWEKVHALLLRGRIWFEKRQSQVAVFEGKSANIRPEASLLGSSWFERGWQLGCSHGEDRSILDSYFSLLTKK